MHSLAGPVVSILAILMFCSPVSAIKENCLKCICARNDCEGRLGKNCTDGVCGPFYISKKYYGDCGSPDGDYEKCTKELDCSIRCVTAFLDKYADDCTYPRQPRCTDYNRMHWSGSTQGCRTLDKVLWEETIQLSYLPLSECCDKLGNCD